MQETCLTTYQYIDTVLSTTSTSCFKPLNVLTFDIFVIFIILFSAYFTYRLITIKNIL